MIYMCLLITEEFIQLQTRSIQNAATSLRLADLPKSVETGQQCWGRCINTTSLLSHTILGFALVIYVFLIIYILWHR